MSIQGADVSKKGPTSRTTHPNVELARDGYAAWGRGDMESVVCRLSDDVVWHIPGRNLLSGDYRGEQGVREFERKIRELSGGTFRIEIGEDDMFANDTHVVVIASHRAERGGRKLSEPFVHVLDVHDGKISAFRPYAADQHAVDEFWS